MRHHRRAARLHLDRDDLPSLAGGLPPTPPPVNGSGAFGSPSPLKSGWAWGQKALEGASAVIVAPIGKGHAILYGPEIYFRSQSHGTFPFLFNGIYYSQSAPR